MNYDNITDLGLTFGDGADNASGVGERAFYIPLSWMETIAKTTPSTTAASLVTIAADHVMKTGKAPIPVQILFDKSGIKWDQTGEMLSTIMKNGCEIFVPSNSLANLGTVGALKNYRGILLVEKIDDSGHFWQIGSEKISAKLMAGTGGTGVGPTGEVGTKYTVESYSQVPVFVYQGDIPPVGA